MGGGPVQCSARIRRAALGSASRLTCEIAPKCVQLASRQVIDGLRFDSARSRRHARSRSPSIARRIMYRASSPGLILSPLPLSVAHASSNAVSSIASVVGLRNPLLRTCIGRPHRGCRIATPSRFNRNIVGTLGAMRVYDGHLRSSLTKRSIGIYGDPINIAARMEEAAGAHGGWIAGSRERAQHQLGRRR